MNANDLITTAVSRHEDGEVPLDVLVDFDRIIAHNSQQTKRHKCVTIKQMSDLLKSRDLKHSKSTIRKIIKVNFGMSSWFDFAGYTKHVSKKENKKHGKKSKRVS